MLKKLRKYVVLTIVVTTALVGLNFGSQTAHAKVKYHTSVPTELRGTWLQKYDKKYTVRLSFTKYTLSQTNYIYGKSEGGIQKLSMKSKSSDTRLGITYKSQHGYYRVGIYKGDMPLTLKPTKHNGKRVLETYSGNPLTGKNDFSYFYKK